MADECIDGFGIFMGFFNNNKNIKYLGSYPLSIDAGIKFGRKVNK